VISYEEEEEKELEFTRLEAAADDAGPSNFERLAMQRLKEEFSGEEVKEAPQPPQNNPHVFQINGISGMNNGIVATKKDCILFLSARWRMTW